MLVVDDEPSIRLLCRVNLELEGYAVREAGTIGDARSQLEGEPADVVLLDVHVGPDSGIEFLNELRRTRPGLPVALLTGSTPADSREHAHADAVIPKPFTLETLAAVVEQLVSAHDTALDPTA